MKIFSFDGLASCRSETHENAESRILIALVTSEVNFIKLVQWEGEDPFSGLKLVKISNQFFLMGLLFAGQKFMKMQNPEF